MGGLMSAASAAQAARGRQTIAGGNDSDPASTYPEDSTLPAPAYAETPSPTRPVFNESLALLPDEAGIEARGDQGAPLQEEYRAKKASALPPGPFDRRLAAYKEQRGMLANNTEASPERASPFARFGSDTEENSLDARNEAAPKPVKLALNNDGGAKADSYGKYEASGGSEKAGFGQLNKPQDQNAGPALRVAQNTPPIQISPVTPDGFKKHPGEIAIEKLPAINKIIEEEAEWYGVNPRWLKIVAYLESRGNPKEKTGSFLGLFQFDPRPRQSWERWGGKGNDPTVAEYSTRAAIREFLDHLKEFRKNFPRDPTLGEMYLMHQQGFDGARVHMQNPDRPAWENLYNGGFRLSREKALSKIEQNLPNGLRLLAPSITSRQFMEFWFKKIEGGEGYGQFKQPLPRIESVPTSQPWYRRQPDQTTMNQPWYLRQPPFIK